MLNRKHFLGLNALAIIVALAMWAIYLYGAQETRVTRCSASGSEFSAAAIEIEFSAPIAAATVTPTTIFLSPAVRGKTVIVDEKRLRFVPEKPLPNATDFRLGLANDLRDVGGRLITAATLTFATPALRLLNLEPLKYDRREGFTLALHFNQPIAEESLRAALKIYEVPKNLATDLATNSPSTFPPPLDLRISGGKTATPRVSFQTHATNVRVGLPADFCGIEGTRGLATAIDEKIDLLQLAKSGEAVKFLGMSAHNEYWRDEKFIIIRTNTPLSAAAAAEYVAIEPAVKIGTAPHYEGLKITGDFQAGRRYQVTLKAGMPAGDLGGLPTTITRSVWFDNQQPQIRFTYGGGYVTPAADYAPKIALTTTALRAVEVEVYRLYVNNLVEYALQEATWNVDELSTKINTQKITPPPTTQETILDLNELTKNAARGVYYLSATNSQSYHRDAIVVVLTDLGITTRISAQQVMAWITSLTTAQPLADVEVKLFSNRRQEIATGKTDANGLVTFAVPPLPEGEMPEICTAQLGDDLSYLRFSGNQQARDYQVTGGRVVNGEYTVFATTERGVYRAGETVYLSGIARTARNQTPENLWCELTVTRPDRREFFKGRVATDAQGRILQTLNLPETARAGIYEYTFTLPQSKTVFGRGNFRVTDFIPPTIKMTITAPTANVNGEKLSAQEKFSLTVKAEHLFGAPAAGLTVKCRAHFTGGVFALTAEARKLASLIKPLPITALVFNDQRIAENKIAVGVKREERVEFSGVLDENGEFTFTFPISEIATGGTISGNFEVEVLENDGRALCENIGREFYPYQFYLGANIYCPQPEQTEPKLNLVVVTPAGEIAAENNAARSYRGKLYRVVYDNVLRHNGVGLSYDWTRQEVLEHEFTGGFNAENLATVNLPTLNYGEYRVVIEAENCAPVTMDWTSQKAGEMMSGKHKPDEVGVRLIKRDDATECWLDAPFAGTALLCVERDQVLATRVVAVKAGANLIENFVTEMVDENWRPNVYLTATLLRPVIAEDNWQPHRASGAANLALDCAPKKLNVVIDAPEKTMPAHNFLTKIKVTDVHGAPVKNAAVIWAAVDSGVLKLTDFKTPSPFDFFYAKRALLVRTADLFNRLSPQLARWQVRNVAAAGGDGGAEGGIDLTPLLSPIRAQRVETAVLFTGNLTTDEHGEARVEAQLPQYLGELRLLVFAAANDLFGTAEKNLTFAAPLMVKAGGPRFVAPHDRLELPLTIFNQLDNADDIEVVVNFDNDLLKIIGENKFILPRAAFNENGEAKIIAQIAVGEKIGVTRVEVVVSAVKHRESEYRNSMALAIRPANGRASFSGGEMLTANTPKTLKLQGDFYPTTASAKLFIAGNLLAAAATAAQQLLDYPYGCLEQTISSALPLITAPDLINHLAPNKIGAEEIKHQIDAVLTRLEQLQKINGGLAMWSGSDVADDFGTIYAGEFLQLAQRAGWAVPENLRRGVLLYLQSRMEKWCTTIDEYGNYAELPHALYALYVLTLAEETPMTWLTRVEELVTQRAEKNAGVLPASIAINLARIYLARGLPELAAALVKNLPQFTDTRQLAGNFRSPLSDAAQTLSLFTEIEPHSPQLPLLAHAVGQALYQEHCNTYENAAALTALAKYARLLPPTPADAAVTLTFADGKTRVIALNKFALLTEADGIKIGEEITLTANAPVYVAWQTAGESRTPNVHSATPTGGLRIQRTLTDRRGNVIGDDALKSGELYYVNFQINAATALPNSLIIDLLPAGLEIENQDLKTTAKKVSLETLSNLHLAHVEPRADRLLLFGDLPAGISRYAYLVRAVTAGKFIYPPTTVENMYDANIRAVSAGNNSEKITVQ